MHVIGEKILRITVEFSNAWILTMKMTIDLVIYLNKPVWINTMS